uniref:Uncharacterized protein n=1 Tax=Spongospora subterranea TaxID=70186 RepID=A0A0H5QPF2_9EUKA|eukprot:CRZ03995.1 hypothetical protein [Spongospora subterranea]
MSDFAIWYKMRFLPHANHPWQDLLSPNPKLVSVRTLAVFRVLSGMFILLNVAWAVSGILPASGGQEMPVHHVYLAYGTNLSATINLTYFLVAGYLTVAAGIKSKNISIRVQRVLHMFYEMALSISLLVLIMFWCVVFFPVLRLYGDLGISITAGICYKNICEHALFGLLMGVDYLITLSTIYPPHYFFSVLILTIYFIFNYISLSIVGKAVYPGMTYQNLYTYVIIFGSYIALAIIFAALYKLGQHKRTPLNRGPNDPIPAEVQLEKIAPSFEP